MREDHIHIGTIILSHIFSQYKIRANSFNLGGHSVNVVKKLITSDPLIQVLVLSFPGIIGEQGEIIYSDFEHINQKNLLTSLSSLTTISIILENDVNVASLGYCSIHPEFRTLPFSISKIQILPFLVLSSIKDCIVEEMVLQGKLGIS